MKTFTLTIVMLSFIQAGKCTELPFFLQPQMEDASSAFLDKSTNPCTDFYQYSCGQWIKKYSQQKLYPFFNPWVDVHKKVIARLGSILSKPGKIKSDALGKAQHFFHACRQRNEISDEKYAQNLKILIKNIYGWPVVDKFWSKSSYDWTLHVIKVARMAYVHPMLKFHVFLDFRNTSQYTLYIKPGELNLPLTILSHPEQHKKYISLYKKLIFETIHELYKAEDISQEVEDIIDLEIKLAKLSTADYKDKSEEVTLSQLTRKFPTINWISVFKKLFEGTSVTVSDELTVLLRTKNYLSDLILLLSLTEPQTIANYVTWCVVRSLAPEVTKYLRQLSFLMDSEVYDVKHNIPLEAECIDKITTYMDDSLIPSYIKEYVSLNTLREIEDISENIKSEFIGMLQTNSWLSNATKTKAIEKLEALKYIVGSSHEFYNQTLSCDEYKKLKITSNHFVNVIRLRMLKSKLELEKLSQTVKMEWPGSVFEVNAYYSLLQNFIFIPLSLMEPPFFNNKASKVLNYGSLGSLIGHEMSHALDVIGRRADKNGNLINWWSLRDKLSYEEATQCFKQHYREYKIDEINTLGENIADNVGMQLSYNAYSKLDVQEGSNRQFFISFAQMWCEVASETQVIDEEDHAPVKTRILGVTQNSKEFERIFQCPPANKSKCKFW